MLTASWAGRFPKTRAAILAGSIAGVAATSAARERGVPEVGPGVPEQVSALGLTDGEWASLAAGKVVVRGDRHRDDEALAQVAGFVVVRAPWTAVFSFVGDHERAPEYSRCTKSVEILSRASRDGRELVKTREVHKALWMTMRYTVDFVHDLEAREIRWALDAEAHNDVRDNRGAWHFASLPDDRTLVAFRVAGVAGKLPRFMLDYFVRKDLPRYLSTLRRVVEGAPTAPVAGPAGPTPVL